MARADRLTVKEFAERYGFSTETATIWIDSGTAPAMRIPGTNRHLILVSWCDAFDRGEPGRWTGQQTPEAVTEPRAIRLVRKAAS